MKSYIRLFLLIMSPALLFNLLFAAPADPGSLKKYRTALDYFNDGKYPEAERELKEYAALYPSGAELKNALKLAVDIDMKQNDSVSAVKNLKKLAGRFPEDEDILETKLKTADLLLKTGRNDEALQIYEWIVDNHPDSGPAEQAEIQIELILVENAAFGPDDSF